MSGGSTPLIDETHRYQSSLMLLDYSMNLKFFAVIEILLREVLLLLFIDNAVIFCYRHAEEMDHDEFSVKPPQLHPTKREKHKHRKKSDEKKRRSYEKEQERAARDKQHSSRDYSRKGIMLLCKVYRPSIYSSTFTTEIFVENLMGA